MTQNTPKKVIIWGYPLHSHTHSYIHLGYYRAFKQLGYDTFWFDNAPAPGFDFKDSLVISEHFATSFLPRDKTSTYFIHYLGNKSDNQNAYLGNVGRLIDLRYNADCWIDKNYNYTLDRSKIDKLSDGTYYENGNEYDIAYTTWATDLLPHEIDLDWRFIKRENVVNYIGTIGGGRGGLFDCQKAPDYYDTVPHIMPFYDECIKNRIEFKSNCPWINPISPDQAIYAVQKSYLAPDFRHQAMLDWGYIPCRVLKNISYGHIGLTNSEAVHRFLGEDVIFNSNSSQLFYDGQEKREDYKFIKNAMITVRDKHTYINRANDLLRIYGEFTKT
jgi:hypothetical protein